MVEFHVLRCADCHTFQVLQVTKTAKWKCKMCGQKQTIVKVYGQGSGADCRRHVQKLNGLQCQVAWTKENNCLISASKVSTSPGFSSLEKDIARQPIKSTTQSSRWSCYLDEPVDEPDDVDESLSAYDERKSDVEMAIDWTDHTRGKMTSQRKSGARNGFLEYSSKKSKVFNVPTRTGSNVCEFLGTRSGCKPYDGQLSTNNFASTLKSVADKNLLDKSEFKVHQHNSLSSLKTAEDKKGNLPFLCERSRDADRVCYQNTSASSESSDKLCHMDRQLVKDSPSHCTRADNERLRVDNKILAQVGTEVNRYLTTGTSKWGAFLDNGSNVSDEDDDDDSSDICLESSQIYL